MKPLMISLNSGTQIPSEGFGTFLISGSEERRVGKECG